MTYETTKEIEKLCKGIGVRSSYIKKHIKHDKLILDYRDRGRVAVEEFVQENPAFCKNWLKRQKQINDRNWASACRWMRRHGTETACLAAAAVVVAMLVGGAIL